MFTAIRLFGVGPGRRIVKKKLEQSQGGVELSTNFVKGSEFALRNPGIELVQGPHA